MIKKILCVLLFLCACVSCAWGDVQINAENFPDDVFREYVRSNFDTDSDDILNEAEISGVNDIYVGGSALQKGNISSLKGIEHFTSLTYLDCSYNQITGLDVSNNTALERLFCSDNQITELDISHNTALTWLYCEHNQLIELDVSKNTALVMLDCWDNRITELDVSNNTKLKELDCSSNQISELDVSNNTALEELNCSRNQIAELDINRNMALKELDCSNNQVATLDVNRNTVLTSLLCYSNKITELDVSSNTALTTLRCSYNQLSELDVSNNTALELLNCSGNQITELDVSNNTALEKLNCAKNQLAALDVSNNPALTTIYCYGNSIAELDLSDNDALYYVEAENQVIKGLELNIMDDGTYFTDLVKDYGLNPAKIDRVISASVSAIDVDGEDVLARYDTASGIAFFSARPSLLSYKYMASPSFDIDVEIKAYPLILSEQPEKAYANRKYSFKFLATGAGSLKWNIDDASKLPDGLSFNTSRGTLTGTPLTEGTYTFALTLSNKISSDTKTFTLEVRPSSESPQSPVITTANSDIPIGYVNASYRFKFSASISSSSLVWSIDSGDIPGLSMSQSGNLLGKPEKSGSFDFTVSVKDTKGGVDTKNFALTVEAESHMQEYPVTPVTPNPGGGSSSGGGGCDSVSGMIMVIGLCVLHGLRKN